MMDREKVIKGLEESIAFFCDRVIGDMFDKWLRASVDALALLKAQAPRVYTVDELKVDNNICCWLEFKDVEENPGITQFMPVVRTDMHEDFDVEFDSGLCVSYGFNYDNYNETWRCWTSRPTDAQREAEPWNV